MLQPTFRPLGLHCAVISLCVATVSGSSLIKPLISRSWHGLALTPHPIIGLGHYSEPKAMYIGSVVRRLYFSTNNEISGLCVLFQRGARPPHILLLQQIRAHNSPQPLPHGPEHTTGSSTFAAGPGQGPGYRKQNESLPRKSCIARESPDINGKCSCQTLYSSKLCTRAMACINHLMSSWASFQIFPSTVFCPQHTENPNSMFLSILQSVLGSTYIPNFIYSMAVLHQGG